MFTLYGVYYYHFLWTETQRYGQRYGHGHGYGCGHVGGVGYEHGAQVGVNDKIYLRPTLVLTFDGFFMVSVHILPSATHLVHQISAAGQPIINQ